MKKEAISLLDKNYPLVSNLANLASFLYSSLPSINWVGFYLVDKKKGYLYLGPFMGPVACYMIPFNKGICGRSYRNKEVVIIDDVHLDKEHIACSSLTNSEMVIPIIKNNEVVALLDIDSPILSRFINKEENEELIDVSKYLEGLF